MFDYKTFIFKTRYYHQVLIFVIVNRMLDLNV